MIHWTLEQDAIILTMAREGTPVTDIARRLGKSMSAVYHRKWRLGEAKSKRPNVVTNDPKIVAEVLRLYHEGYRYKDIMAKLGITKDNVSIIIREHAPTKRSKRDIKGMRIYPDELIQKVKVCVVDEDLPARVAAERLGVRYHVVRDICYAHGIRRSQRWTPSEVANLCRRLEAGEEVGLIATSIGRSVNAMFQRLSELRLAHRYPQVAMEVGRVRRGSTLESVMSFRAATCRDTDKKRGRPCDLTTQHLIDLWHQQGGTCHYTGRPMTLAIHQPMTVSVDRVDSTMGHVMGNLVLCGRQVNTLKGSQSVAEFVDLCRDVVSHTSKRVAMPSAA